MNNILPLSPAKELCLQMMEEFDNSDFSKRLFEKDCGRMFGILTCTDGTVYKAFSGQLFNSYEYEGFVPPCFDISKTDKLLKEYDLKIKNASKEEQKILSKECWEKLCSLYEFHTFDNSVVRLSDITLNVPAGTGDCCAPRLLSYCYKNGKKPQSMCEFYYGNGTSEHKQFYNPCSSRCKPILKYIIGLDVLYLDDDIVVVNKPSGLLAIEGKGQDKQDCIAKRVRNLYQTIDQPCIHRLDQATSGLMVLGLTKKAHDTLSLDFENRKIYKEYEALVKGKIIEKEGTINLPMRLDTDNRPHQIVDFENGKQAITKWQNLGIHKSKNGYVTRLLLIPQTGRTHQLRLHCLKGLGHEILNDTLYGSDGNVKEPLMLQATKLVFNHPTTKQEMTFVCEKLF